MKLKTWWITIRPKTLTASILPLTLSLFLTYDYGILNDLPFEWYNALFVIASVVLIQIFVNLTNDYYDYQNNVDTNKKTLRGLQSGRLTLKEVRNTILIVLLILVISIIYFSYTQSYQLIYLGLLSILSAYLYTGGPFPFAYNALGDVFVLIFFGPIAIIGISMCMIGDYFPTNLFELFPFILVSITSGLLGVCLLTINNLRDADDDKKNNKKTLIVLLGKNFGKLEYIICFLLAYLSYYLYVKLYYFDSLLPLLGLLQLPFLIHMLFTLKKDELNKLLGQTSLNMLTFSILLIIGNFH